MVDAAGERIYGEEKMRVPSWCDRVLWRTHPNTPVTQLEYHCQDRVQSSDHSPVYSTFLVEARLPPSLVPALSGSFSSPWVDLMSDES